jgi:hypothetical protein
VSLSGPLEWSSRPAIARQLVRLLQAGDSGRRLRLRAAELLELFATPSEHRTLRAVLLDPAEDGWLRTYALRALRRTGGTVDAAELSLLLQEWVQRPKHQHLPHVRMTFDQPSVAELLSLVRPDTMPGALKVLGELTSAERVELLHHSRELPEVVLDWLFDRWVAEDREALDDDGAGDDRNLDIAFTQWRRLPALAWLREELASGRPPGDRWPLQDEADAIVEACPELLPWALRDLALSIPKLVEKLGRHGLLARLQRCATLTRLRTRYPASVIDGDDKQWPLWIMIARWPEARRLFLNLVCTTAEELEDVRRSMLQALPETERTTLRRWAEAAVSYPSVHGCLARVLARLAEAPVEADRELLVRCLRVSHGAVLYQALAGLEKLRAGAGTLPLVRNLMSHPNPMVQAQAIGTVALTGDTAACAQLRALAESETHPGAAATALRLLWQVDPAPTFALLEEALIEDGNFFRDYWLPAACEAARILLRIDSDDARTALLNGALLCKSQGVQAILLNGLDDIAQLGYVRASAHDGWQRVVIDMLEATPES